MNLRESTVWACVAGIACSAATGCSRHQAFQIPHFSPPGFIRIINLSDRSTTVTADGQVLISNLSAGDASRFTTLSLRAKDLEFKLGDSKTASVHVAVSPKTKEAQSVLFNGKTAVLVNPDIKSADGNKNVRVVTYDGTSCTPLGTSVKIGSVNAVPGTTEISLQPGQYEYKGGSFSVQKGSTYLVTVSKGGAITHVFEYHPPKPMGTKASAG